MRGKVSPAPHTTQKEINDAENAQNCLCQSSISWRRQIRRGSLRIAVAACVGRQDARVSLVEVKWWRKNDGGLISRQAFAPLHPRGR